MENALVNCSVNHRRPHTLTDQCREEVYESIARNERRGGCLARGCCGSPALAAHAGRVGYGGIPRNFRRSKCPGTCGSLCGHLLVATLHF